MHRTSKKITLAIAVLTSVLSACTDNKPSSSGQQEDTRQPGAVAARPKDPLFEQRCAGCHGSDGTAGIGNAANLKISTLDSAALAGVIANGKGAMPPFRSSLSEPEIEKLASYVYELRK